MSAALFWFRQDLRLFDNPGLKAAASARKPLVLLYLRDATTPDDERTGAASDWWLHHSLKALSRDIALRGSRLVLRSGKPLDVLMHIVHEQGVDELHVNQVYEPAARVRDDELFAALGRCGVRVHRHLGSVLFEPGTILNKAGGPYRVFTPFYEAGCLARESTIAPARPAPRVLRRPPRIRSEKLPDWSLTPRRPDWARGFRDVWRPGEAGGRKALRRFVSARARWYADSRDRPDWDGTSRLSAHLHFGELAPWMVWHKLRNALPGEDGAPFLRQLGWREFSYHLMWHFPDMVRRNLRPAFDGFPWRRDAADLRAWQCGLTGYPIVDAGMRQLWRTGWMHNRVRMVAASFLVKDLAIHWREGERWFRDTLVDADLANNTAGWQWVAGSGHDAAPFYRIFNPVRQGERFDPEGQYVRSWVPELAGLETRYLHAPWQAPPEALSAAGVRLGRDYPRPIVDHGAAAEAALAAYRGLRARRDLARATDIVE